MNTLWIFDPVELDIATHRGFPVATVSQCATDKETMDHGYLLAAAPELFAALERFTSDLEDCYGGESQMKHSDATRYRQARAAMAKAKGELS